MLDRSITGRSPVGAELLGQQLQQSKPINRVDISKRTGLGDKQVEFSENNLSMNDSSDDGSTQKGKGGQTSNLKSNRDGGDGDGDDSDGDMSDGGVDGLFN